MTYLQQDNWQRRPVAIAGVVAIHAVIGYALVTGLSFTKIVEVVQNPDSIFVPAVKLPPPPPPPPDQAADPVQRVSPPAHAPKQTVDLSDQRPSIETSPVILPIPETLPYVVPKPTPLPGPTARPAFDPVSAKPRGNPGSWVTVNDYRSSWINREWTGTARFRVEVGENGRVRSCTITGSSGHPELDQATCALVTQRARFDPAKDDTGTVTAGSYSNAVRWELPD